MAQTRPAPAAGAVPDPGGTSLPVNSGATVPAPLLPGRPPSPSIASVGVSRPASTLPLNTPQTQKVPQLAGGSPAPAIQAVSSGPGGASLPTASQPATTAPLGGGMVAVSAAGSVADPGAARFALGQNQAIGMPPDTAVVAAGDPGAMGGYVPGPTQSGAQWSQANISGNPNPGALSGGPAGPAPTYLPGQTGVNQVSPEANPNPGGL